MIFGAEAIFENEAGDAEAVEPLGDRYSFVGSEVHVCTARADDEGCAGGFVFRGEEWGYCRDVDVGYALGSGGILLPEADGWLGCGGG